MQMQYKEEGIFQKAESRLRSLLAERSRADRVLSPKDDNPAAAGEEEPHVVARMLEQIKDDFPTISNAHLRQLAVIASVEVEVSGELDGDSQHFDGNARNSGGRRGSWVNEAGLLVTMISLAAAINHRSGERGSGLDGGALELFLLLLLVLAGVNLIAVGVCLQSRAENLGRAMFTKAADFARRNLAVLVTIAASAAATGVIVTTAQPGLCFIFFALFLLSVSLVTIGIF